MQMSQDGLNKLVLREGLRLNAYQDVRGIWTIGVGHTSAAGDPDVDEGLQITKEEAYEIFARDLKQYEDAVNQSIHVPLEQHQFDALVSFTYNVGVGGEEHSSLARDINSGADADTIYDDFMKWDKPAAIIGRRKSEADQFSGS